MLSGCERVGLFCRAVTLTLLAKRLGRRATIYNERLYGSIKNLKVETVGAAH